MHIYTWNVKDSAQPSLRGRFVTDKQSSWSSVRGLGLFFRGRTDACRSRCSRSAVSLLINRAAASCAASTLLTSSWSCERLLNFFFEEEEEVEEEEEEFEYNSVLYSGLTRKTVSEAALSTQEWLCDRSCRCVDSNVFGMEYFSRRSASSGCCWGMPWRTEKDWRLRGLKCARN